MDIGNSTSGSGSRVPGASDLLHIATQECRYRIVPGEDIRRFLDEVAFIGKQQQFRLYTVVLQALEQHQ